MEGATKVAKKKTKPGKVTTKRVQATECDPVEVPDFIVKPENDDDEDAGVDGLNMRRRAFVEYVTSVAFGNPTRAAAMAGYSDSNRNVLRATASRLLTFVNVQRSIREKLAAAQMTAEGTRNAIAAYASSDMSAFISVGESGEPVLDWVKAAACGHIGNIREFKEEGIQAGDKVTIIKRTFKLRDPMPALALMARMHGLVQDAAPSVSVTVNQMSDDDLVRIATRGSEGSSETPQGAGVSDRLR